MSVIATALRELMAAGITGEALIAAVERIEAAQVAARAPVRTARQERNARYYENRKARLEASEASETVLNKTAKTLSDDRIGKEGPTTQETTTPVEITPSDPKGSSVPKETKRTDRGTFIASDWQPSADEWAFAIAELGSEASAARQRDKFRNFWLGKSGSDGRKRDWPATWRNWVMREAEDSTASRFPANPRASPARFEGRDSAATVLLKRDAEARRYEQSYDQPDFLDDGAGTGGSQSGGRSPRDASSQRDRMGGTGQILDLVAVGSNRR